MPKHHHKGRNRRSNRKDYEIRHPHFAVRKLPQDIFGYYRDKNQTDDIVGVTYYNSEEGPAIDVERSDELDTWRWQGHSFHCAMDKLPKQIFRFYRQAQRTQNVISVEYYEDDEGNAVVEIDLGNVRESWGWESSEDEKFFCWKRTDTEEQDGEVKELNFEKIESKWLLAETEPVNS